MSLLGEIQKLVEEHGSASILRERLSFWQDRLNDLEKQKVELERKLTECEKAKTQLQAQLTSKVSFEEFVEVRGALFKRKPEGGYHLAVYCPSCKRPMSSLEKIIPYHCNSCKVSVDFRGQDLPEVLAELPK